jgi:heme/copper-type cytochrome/quinol oxidase subunit 3
VTAVTVQQPLPHHEHPDTVGRRWRAGVLLLILADASFVFSLVFAYFYLRGLNTEDHWFGTHAKSAPIWVGWVIAAVLVLSAVAYLWGLKGVEAGSVSRLGVGLGLAVLLMVVGTVVQILQMATLPFGIGHNAYSSCVYVLAGANLFHMLMSLFIGIGLWNRTRAGLYSQGNYWQIRVAGTWWAWVALAAVIGAVPLSFITAPGVGG